MESRQPCGSSDSQRSPPPSGATTAAATASAASAMPPAQAPVVATAPVAVPAQPLPTLLSPAKVGEPMAKAKATLPTLANVEASDTTMSSSERESSCSCSCSCSDSSADALDDNYGVPELTTDEDDEDEDDEEDEEDDDDRRNRFLVKPMPSRLQVCPVDDLAVEDEKRRRRSRRNKKVATAAKTKGKAGANGKKQLAKGASRDAESLPSTPSPLMVMTRRSGNSSALSLLDRSASTPTSSKSTSVVANQDDVQIQRRNSQTSSPPLSAAAVGPTNDTLLPPAVPELRKDSAAIRRQYWSQLGFNLSRRDLEKSTGRKHQRREGLKVRLNDADAKEDAKSKSFFQFITSWYAPMTVVEEDTSSRAASARRDSKRQMRSSLSRSSATSTAATTSEAAAPRKGVHFKEEAELFYIPLHRDYSKRQRECMWPTRSEFVAMVERNLDAVYDEMEREYEAQLENEFLENDGMAREEARQRTVEAQIKSAAQAAAIVQRNASPPLSRSMSSASSSSLSAAVPSLTLSEKQVTVSPRMSRSSQDIRFKYLKHLGINS